MKKRRTVEARTPPSHRSKDPHPALETGYQRRGIMTKFTFGYAGVLAFPIFTRLMSGKWQAASWTPP